MAVTRLKKIVPYCETFELSEHETPTSNVQVLTPSDVANLSRQGIPVSAGQLPSFQVADDMTDSLAFDMPAEYRKGYDRNSAWEMSKVAESKLARAYKSDRKKFG